MKYLINKMQKQTKASNNHMHIMCNYSNNYYGDQQCIVYTENTHAKKP